MTHDEVAKKVAHAVAATYEASEAVAQLLDRLRPTHEGDAPSTEIVRLVDWLAVFEERGRIIVEATAPEDATGDNPVRMSLSVEHARALAERLAQLT